MQASPPWSAWGRAEHTCTRSFLVPITRRVLTSACQLRARGDAQPEPLRWGRLTRLFSSSHVLHQSQDHEFGGFRRPGDARKDGSPAGRTALPQLAVELLGTETGCWQQVRGSSGWKQCHMEARNSPATYTQTRFHYGAEGSHQTPGRGDNERGRDRPKPHPGASSEQGNSVLLSSSSKNRPASAQSRFKK